MYNASLEQTTIFTKDVTIEYASILTNDVFNNGTSQNRLQYPKNVLLRNMSLGILGILGNALATALVTFNKKVKFPLKLTLVCLSLNDLIFSCTAVVYGMPGWVWSSDSPQCWPVVYVVLSTIILSHGLTCLLALNNVVAVFFPLKCNIIITNARSVGMVLSAWVAAYAMALACFGVHLPRSMQCFAIALISRAGLGILCGIALACIAFTIVANVLIIRKLRNRRKINDVFVATVKVSSPQDSVDRTQETELVSNVEDELRRPALPGTSGTSKFKRSGGRILDFLYPRKVVNLNNTSEDEKLRIAIISGSNKPLDQYPAPSCSVASHNLQCASVPSWPTHQLHENRAKIRNDETARRTDEDVKPKVATAQAAPCDSPKEESKMKLAASLISPPVNARRHHRNRIKSTSNTLLIMTCWSCVLAFPLLVDGFYLTIWQPDIQQFSSSLFGILVSSLNVTHSLANPFMYAWRFVSWRRIFTEIKVRRQRNITV